MLVLNPAPGLIFGVSMASRRGSGQDDHTRITTHLLTSSSRSILSQRYWSCFQHSASVLKVGVVNLCLDRVYLTSRGLGGWASGNTFPPPFLSAPNILDGHSRSCATCIHYACVYTEERRVYHRKPAVPRHSRFSKGGPRAGSEVTFPMSVAAVG